MNPNLKGKMKGRGYYGPKRKKLILRPGGSVIIDDLKTVDIDFTSITIELPDGAVIDIEDAVDLLMKYRA